MGLKERPQEEKWLHRAVLWAALAAACAAVLYSALTELLTRLGVNIGLAHGVALLVPAALGAVAALWLGRRFLQGLAKLRSAVQTVAEGDLSVRLPQEEGPFAASYSDFNQMAQEVEADCARRDAYVNTLTHEFKTPLTAIRGFAEMLQEPGFSEEEQRKYLQIIADESSQLAELANNALLLTKLEAKNLPVVKKTFWLDEQVSRCLTLMQGSAKEKNQTLRADLEPVEIRSSEELLSHVWINLVGNAVKYTPEGGTITVTLHLLGVNVIVTVTDTGIGMTDEVRQHIFDRYYQADPSNTRKGIGLGLPIVQNVVKVCGGRIEVESAPGRGSTFRVVLPVGLPAESSLAVEPVDDELPSDSRKELPPPPDSQS